VLSMPLLRSMWIGAPLALVASVYLLTMAPGAYSLDSAELATGAYTLGIVHPTGYPLYMLIAKGFTLLPWGSVAWRVNLLSVVCGLLAVASVWRLGFLRSRQVWVALAGAMGLAFSIGYWRMSTVAEVYTLHIVILTGLLLLCNRWLATGRETYVIGMGLLFGLGLANHVSSLSYAPILVVAITGRRGSGRTLWFLPLSVAVGLATYLYLPARASANPALDYVRQYYAVDLTTIEGVWWMASGAAYRFFAFGYDAPGYLQELVRFCGSLLRNMTALGFVLGMLGIWQTLRRIDRLGIGMGVVFLLNVGFFSGYAVGDKETMFLPAYTIWALWMIDGAAWALRSARRFAFREGLSPAVAGAGLGILMASMVGMLLVMNWRWADLSKADMPERSARLILRSLPADAFIAGPWSETVVLEYVQLVEGVRPDVEIFNRSRYEVAQYYSFWAQGMHADDILRNVHARERELIRSAAAARPVFDLQYVPSLARTLEYRPVGPMFQVEPYKGSETPILSTGPS